MKETIIFKYVCINVSTINEMRKQVALIHSWELLPFHVIAI